MGANCQTSLRIHKSIQRRMGRNCILVPTVQAIRVPVKCFLCLAAAFMLIILVVFSDKAIELLRSIQSRARNTPDHKREGGEKRHQPHHNRRECFTFNGTGGTADDIELFSDILDDHARPSPAQRNIFFHCTTCLADAIAQLSVRQACAVESAARTNPNTNVYVLFASPVGFARNSPAGLSPSSPPAIFRALAALPNVRWHNVNVWTYAKATPAVDRWMQSGELFAQSAHLSVHMSDVLRLVSLFRWGGTHIDLDFVMRRSLERLPVNYAGELRNGHIGNGLMNLDATGIGHQIAGHLLERFVAGFNGSEFAANGPVLLGRVLRQLCDHRRNDAGNDLRHCPYMRTYGPAEFYAIHHSEWRHLFDAQHSDIVMGIVRDSMAVHMWNEISGWQGVVRLGERSAYERLAQQFCPSVLQTAAPKGVF